MKQTLKIVGLAVAAVAAMMTMPAFAMPLTVPDDIRMLIGFGGNDMPMLVGFGGILVNSESLHSVFTGLKTIFNNALKAVGGNWQATAMEIPSTGAGEDYAWLTRFPRMRKWVGEKFIKALEAGKYYKKNEDWEATIAVKRNDIEDDRLGIYEIQSKGAGESAGELNDIIVDDLKANAFVSECMDGQYFYDTDHPSKDSDGVETTFSNKGTKKLSSDTLAKAKAGYGAAREAIMGFKDSEGMPLRLIPDTLEVGPSMEAPAVILTTADKLGDNSPNPYKGSAKVVVNPTITDDRWMLHVTTKVVKPFIVQMRKKPVFVSQTDMNADDVFMKAEYKFGAEARATGVYGFPQLSYGSTGTVAA